MKLSWYGTASLILEEAGVVRTFHIPCLPLRRGQTILI